MPLIRAALISKPVAWAMAFLAVSLIVSASAVAQQATVPMPHLPVASEPGAVSLLAGVKRAVFTFGDTKKYCDFNGEKVSCSYTGVMGTTIMTENSTGVVSGNRLSLKGSLVGVFGKGGDQEYTYQWDTYDTVYELSADGAMKATGSTGGARLTACKGLCKIPKTLPTPSQRPEWIDGKWEIISGQQQPLAGEAPQQVVLTTPDGKTVTINLSEWNGGTLSVQQMALVKQLKLAPPPGSDAAKASGGAGYTLNAYNYLRATGPNVPVFVGMPRLDEGAQAAASVALEGAQATASWVKANPGKTSLAALGLAVAIAMPYTVAFQASAVGMTFFESAGIGFMTAATPAAVSSLATSAISGEGFWTMSGKAALSGTISGAESLVSTVVGTGVTGMVTGGAALTQKLVGSQFSEAAVTGFGAVTSGVASTATDLGVGVLHDQVAADIANSASTTNIPDIVTPSGPAPTGGIVLPFLSRPSAPSVPK